MNPLITDYLDRLSWLLRDLDHGDRDEVLEGVREHLDAALVSTAGDDEVRAVLSELGSAEEVAREAHAYVSDVASAEIPDDEAASGTKRKRRAVALLVSAAVLALLVLTPLMRSVPSPLAAPVFPSGLYIYSWFNGPVSRSHIDAATALFGVAHDDIGTDPQAVLLGTDGTSYRELNLAHRLSPFGDGGYPVPSALSPEGSFVVVGNTSGSGKVHVLTLRDGSRRVVEIGRGLTAHPLAIGDIGDDGQSVLLGTHQGPGAGTRGRRLELARLNLDTGKLTEYPDVHVTEAALSPDGSQILALTRPRQLRLIDSVDGTATDLPSLGRGPIQLSSGAWSRDGSQFAVGIGRQLAVFDANRPSSPKLFDLKSRYGGTVLAWRDESTVLLHSEDDHEVDWSHLAWADTTTGEVERFSSSRAGSDAGIYSIEVARALVPQWRVEDGLDVGRGGPPLGMAIGASVIAGVLSYLIYPRPAVSRRRESGRELVPV